MATWTLVYSVLSALLLGVAIYEHTSAATLSLPISRASTISTILLPILSFLNTIYYVNSSPRSQTQSSQATCNSLLAPGLQLIQIILTTVLGTTFLADMIPAATQQCLLSTRWQQLWSTKDSSTIRRIQDTFDCCGFNSVKDRAWPFPNKANPQPDCATHLGRTGACVGPWTQALQASGGVEFGVVLGVGVLQLISVLLFRYLRSRNGCGEGAGAIGWMSSAIKRLSGRDEEYSDRAHLNRPLLEDGFTSSARGPREQPNSNRNNDLDDEAHPSHHQGTNGYGGTSGRNDRNGVRVEPSHLDPWAGDSDNEA